MTWNDPAAAPVHANTATSITPNDTSMATNSTTTHNEYEATTDRLDVSPPLVYVQAPPEQGRQQTYVQLAPQQTSQQTYVALAPEMAPGAALL